MTSWRHRSIIAMVANDDEFVSNIALIECWRIVLSCGRTVSRVEKYEYERKKRNGRSWYRSSDCSVYRPVRTLYFLAPNTVVSECSLIVTVASRQSMTDGMCRVSSVRIGFCGSPMTSLCVIPLLWIEVTSESLWSRYDRHFVGITRCNALS